MSKFSVLSTASLRAMFLPIVRLCLKSSVGVSEIVEIVKSCLIEAAKDEMLKNGEKLNSSRLSVMTGLQRRDVSRLLDSGVEVKESLTIVSRVIGQWEHDARFTTKAGVPKILDYEGKSSEFAKLVAAVSKDVHHGTVLFELNRLNMIEYVKGGIKLISKAQNLRSDPQKAYQLVASDISDLVKTTSENLFANEDIPHLHARTEYDNVFKEDLPLIKEWLLKEGSDFHRRAREYISGFDKDLNPHVRKEGGAKVSVSAFSSIKKER